jgi:hypothetical protein
MESPIIILVYAVVAAIAYGTRDRSVDSTTVSLCLTCVNAMITRGTSGEKRIACTYGGVLRPVTFTVCECTGYCSNRNASKLVKIEGFVRDEGEVYAEVRIS